jgi:hypothetical protein
MRKRKFVTVYRVEERKSSRQGPYVHHGWYERWHAADRPEKEDWFTYKTGMVFGFRSMRQLNAWFNAAELHQLRRHGFIVRAYDVSARDIVYGKHQVAFHRPYQSDEDLANERARRNAEDEDYVYPDN